MKAFSVLFVIVASFALINALTDEQKQKVKEHRIVCQKDSGADEEVINKAKNGELVEDPKLKAFLYCFGKRIGFQNEAGEYQKDVMKTKLSADYGDKAAEIVDACTKDKFPNGADNALHFVKCFGQKAPKGASLFYVA